ncbi:Type IV pilus modification protein PilV [Comamonas aquatilis]|uniref:type IV pilus modification protein PilV n=1 Tax=Comamonas aquatilis TaxID=1778406 RepID=UPI0039F091B4
MHIKTSRKQNGFTLIESLIAILLTALGILGILGVQMRTLANTQDTMRRTQSIRLIEDLSERIKNQTSGIANASQYTTSWVDLTQSITTPSADCTTTNCTAVQLADFDKNIWLNSVKNSLPLGKVRVFATADGKSLGVMLAWRSNESSAGTMAAAQAVDASGATVQCPKLNANDDNSPNMSCHLQFISLEERCQTIGSTAYCASN